MTERISAFFQSVKQNSCEILQNTVAAGVFLFSGGTFFSEVPIADILILFSNCFKNVDSVYIPEYLPFNPWVHIM